MDIKHARERWSVCVCFTYNAKELHEIVELTVHIATDSDLRNEHVE